jgi:HAD superfamily hydrolase (TIGR01450 family)
VNDLLDRHDVLLTDLDGTLYRGPAVVPGAVEALHYAMQRGVRRMYVTNNASRRPGDVAHHLAELGFPASADDVVTSAQAGATLLAQQLPPGAPVLVVGTDALVAEVVRVGLTVTDRAEKAVAVVQGHSPTTGWPVLAEATVALRAGAVWVACNVDPTLPTERGPLPGNGAMVAAVRIASGREPQVAGKPAPALMRDAVRRTGARAALMVGDRLDTDIEGGRAAGVSTLLVLTGSTSAAELLAAPPAQRPDYVGADLGVLRCAPAALAPGPRSGWSVDGGPAAWILRATDDTTDDTADDTDADPVDALRALCDRHWAEGGGPARVFADGAAAARALRQLGLGVPGPEPAASATVAGADPGPGAHP